jgi:hypothetical protein
MLVVGNLPITVKQQANSVGRQRHEIIKLAIWLLQIAHHSTYIHTYIHRYIHNYKLRRSKAPTFVTWHLWGSSCGWPVRT